MLTGGLASPPQAPSPRGEDLCRLCAEGGSTCCATDPALTYLSFPLSPPELRRLLPYAALATLSPAGDEAAFAREEEQARRAARALEDPAAGASPAGRGASGAEEEGGRVAAPEPNHPDFVASMRVLFPRQGERVEALFPSGREHMSLRTRADGACVFLGSLGCRLPRDARPWYCLLFPAWVSGGGLTLFFSPDCLISQKARGPAHGIALLGIPPHDVRALHARLCRDWGLEDR